MPSKWLSSTMTLDDWYSETMSSVSPPLPLLWSMRPPVTWWNWTKLPVFLPVRADGPVMF